MFVDVFVLRHCVCVRCVCCGVCWCVVLCCVLFDVIGVCYVQCNVCGNVFVLVWVCLYLMCD